MTMLKRVVWFGNWFEDRYHIIKDGKYHIKFNDGGIHNCNIGFLDNCYEHEPDAPGEANFLLSAKQQESAVDFKYSIDLTEKGLEKYTDGADWLHIAYIDALPNLDLSKVDKTLFKVISCDLCHPKEEIVKPNKILENLKCCDFVFDCQGAFGRVRYQEQMENKIWILHSPGGSIISYNASIFRKDVFKQKYIFTVGAGDRFAAAFIEGMLNSKSLIDSQEFAHEKVGKWLEEVNNGL